MIYAEHPTCLSEAAVRVLGYRRPKHYQTGKLPDWAKAIQIQRQARASDGRIYALMAFLDPFTQRKVQAWADIITGTLYRPKDGACWSSIKALDLKSMQPVAEPEIRAWIADAKERSKRLDWYRGDE